MVICHNPLLPICGIWSDRFNVDKYYNATLALHYNIALCKIVSTRRKSPGKKPASWFPAPVRNFSVSSCIEATYLRQAATTSSKATIFDVASGRRNVGLSVNFNTSSFEHKCTKA